MQQVIPHVHDRLDNGLQVILHRDPRLPRVAVSVLFRVGSRDDPPGMSGAAHLFEHLMFMGTRRVPRGQFDLIMEQEGGWNNAYTSSDLTVYYDVGPARLLERLLWLEADRMATLCAALTRAKLDRQRDVVLNELWQEYDSAPYGVAALKIPALVFPRGHPYSWPVIGAEEDLRSITVEDIRQLSARFYSPGNATVVVAGQFETEEVRRLVQRTFGAIPPGAPLRAGPRRRLARPAPAVRRTFHDSKVELPKLFLIWRSPPFLQPGDAEMDLAAEMLAEGKRSRLCQNLVHERRLALKVEAYQESRHLASQFVVEVTARSGVDPGRLEQATRQVLEAFLKRPPSAREMARARNGYETYMVSSLQRLLRRTELLGLYAVAAGRPDFLAWDMDRYRGATRDSVHGWSQRVLHHHRHVTVWVVS